jgi:hypothetical protein
MRQIVRDPFARHTLVRVVLRPLALVQSCSWCGSAESFGRCRTPFLYRYGTEPDAIQPRVAWHRGAFCAKSCHDAYHHVDRFA